MTVLPTFGTCDACGESGVTLTPVVLESRVWCICETCDVIAAVIVAGALNGTLEVRSREVAAD